MKARRDEAVRPRLERRVASHDRDLRVLGRGDHLAVGGGALGRHPRRRCAAALRAAGAVVREQHRRAPLRAMPAARNSARPQIRSASPGSTYGLSKRPSRNLSRSRRRADSSMRASVIRPARTSSTTTSGSDSPPSWSQPASRIFRTRSSALELLDAPALRPNSNRRESVSLTSAPVGADDAVEAVPPAQQSGDHAAVEAEADLLEADPERAPVVRHDLRGPGRERSLERPAGGPRTSRRGRPDPSRTGSAGPRRLAAGRHRGSASSCTRRMSVRAARPGSRGCRRRRVGRRALRPRRRCA